MTATILIEIVAERSSPAAPVGQQAPPARAAASAIRARRVANSEVLKKEPRHSGYLSGRTFLFHVFLVIYYKLQSNNVNTGRFRWAG
jgi:hypothetical protein